MNGFTEVDVIVIGGGPAGLAAATRLRELGTKRVLVIEREGEPGGIPRSCHHTGFGWFDLRRILSGPRYATLHAKRALDAGASIETHTTAISWSEPGSIRHVTVTGPGGTRDIAARAVLLATGCRERPRTARLVPGGRPRGVHTTGSLQHAVHGYHQTPGSTAVVVGAEHVSYSAVMTLRESGVEVKALVTPHPVTQTFGLAHWWIAGRNRIPLHTEARVTRIVGRDRVSAIEYQVHDTPRKIDCDTVVFTGDWIPDHEFCRIGGVPLNPHTRGPAIDQALRTETPGVFACGNLLRGAETADSASLEGRHAAQSIHSLLSGKGSWPEMEEATPVEVRDPVQWVCPNRISGSRQAPARGRLTFRVGCVQPAGDVVVVQGTETLARISFRKMIPNRAYSIRWDKWACQVQAGVPVVIGFDPS